MEQLQTATELVRTAQLSSLNSTRRFERKVRHVYYNTEPIGGPVIYYYENFCTNIVGLQVRLEDAVDAYRKLNKEYTSKLCSRQEDIDVLVDEYGDKFHDQYKVILELLKLISDAYHSYYFCIGGELKLFFDYLTDAYNKTNINYFTLKESDLDFIIKCPRNLKLGSKFDMLNYPRIFTEQEDTIAYTFTSVNTLTDFIFTARDSSLQFMESVYNSCREPISEIQAKLGINPRNVSTKDFEAIDESIDSLIMYGMLLYHYTYFSIKKICICLKIIENLRYI